MLVLKEAASVIRGTIKIFEFKPTHTSLYQRRINEVAAAASINNGVTTARAVGVEKWHTWTVAEALKRAQKNLRCMRKGEELSIT